MRPLSGGLNDQERLEQANERIAGLIGQQAARIARLEAEAVRLKAEVVRLTNELRRWPVLKRHERLRAEKAEAALAQQKEETTGD